MNPPDRDMPDIEASMAPDPQGRIHIAWLREGSPANLGMRDDIILYARRDVTGTFSSPTVIVDRPRVEGFLDRPSVAWLGGELLVAWVQVGSSTNGIYLKRSGDGGMTFGPPIRVQYASGVNTDAQWSGAVLAVSPSGALYLAWLRGTTAYTLAGGDLFVSRSDDAGQSWTAPTWVNPIPGTAKQSWPPSYALGFDSGGDLAVAWANLTDRYRGDLQFGVSRDGGASFGPWVRASDNESYLPGQPSIAIGPDGLIHLAWRDFRSRSNQVWYASSPDGVTFGANRRISNTIAGPGIAHRGFQLLAENASSLYLFWTDATDGTPRAMLSHSSDGGLTFGPGVRVDSFNSEQHPDGILMFQGRVTLLWSDYSTTRVPGKPANVVFSLGSSASPIVSYAWDLDAAVDSDRDGNATDDVDAAGVSPLVVYGDDGTYTITLRVTDANGRSASASTLATIRNLPPAILSIRAVMVANLTLRIAGEKWHDVAAYLDQGGNESLLLRLVRTPGVPQEATVPLALDPANASSLRLAYTPREDPVNGQANGATPAWLVLTFDSGPPASGHHPFNARQPETWNWSVDLSGMLTGRPVRFTATATDPGADDLTFAWDFGDGSPVVTALHPDSAGVFPFTATDAATHAYALAGGYRVTVRVTDDDGGAAEAVAVVWL